MNLKILLFPTFVILSVILIIGYIQPDVKNILAKREEEVAKQEMLRNAETIESNIRSLSQALTQKKEIETFVKRYFPESIDEERSLDVINFLAQQTGVVVTGVSMKENPRVKKEVFLVDAIGAGADPTALASGTEASVENSAPEPPQSYRVQVMVMGTYQNLRSFFDRLYHTDRMRAIDDLILSRPSDAERFREEREIIPADFLEGSVTFDFLYVPAESAGNALAQPLFQESSLDFGPANQLVDFVNSPVGDIMPAGPGRSNPFEAIP